MSARGERPDNLSNQLKTQYFFIAGPSFTRAAVPGPCRRSPNRTGEWRPGTNFGPLITSVRAVAVQVAHLDIPAGATEGVDPLARRRAGVGSILQDPINDLSATRWQRRWLDGDVDPGKREAQSKAREIMSTINRAKYVSTSQINVGKFLDEYVALHVDRLATSTRGKYLAHMKNHIRPTFEKMMLCDLQPLLVQRWLDTKDTLSWASRTDIRNILSSVYTKVIE